MSETEVGEMLRLGNKHFLKLGVIGSGGYASVSSFWQLDQNKLPLASKLVAIKTPFYQGRSLARLESETLILTQKRCDDKSVPLPTVEILMKDWLDGDDIIIMEHGAGTLAQLPSAMKSDDIFYVAKQLLKGLHTLHKVGKFIHSDVKPENILMLFTSDDEKLKHAMFLVQEAIQTEKLSVGARRRLVDVERTLRAAQIFPQQTSLNNITQRKVILGDVGLSTPISRVASMQTNTGTLGYMPVECLAGGPITPKIDVFSFGVTIVELVLGKPLMKIVGSSLKVKSLNLLHQLVNLKGPMTAGLVASLRERNEYFVGGTLRESVNAPQTPKIEDLLLLRCTELLWSADDIRRITTVASMCLRHSYAHRSPISTLLKKLEEEYVE